MCGTYTDTGSSCGMFDVIVFIIVCRYVQFTKHANTPKYKLSPYVRASKKVSSSEMLVHLSNDPSGPSPSCKVLTLPLAVPCLALTCCN